MAANQNPFTSIKGSDHLSSKTLSNPVLAYGMMMNWVVDNAIFQEKQFTLQVMAFQKQVSPLELIGSFEKNFFTLDSMPFEYPFLLWDNEWNWYTFEAFPDNLNTSSICTRANFDDDSDESIQAGIDKHVLTLIRKDFLENNNRGPWVVEIMYNGKHNKKTTNYAVIKYMDAGDE